MGKLAGFFKDFWSLISGMGVTARYMFKKPVTVLYPKEERVTPRFKGPIAFTTDELDGSHKCIACNACIKACPSRCMALEVKKNETNARVLADFKVDYSLCSLCGICIEVCPTDALMHDTPRYAIATTTRGGMLNDLLQPFREKGVNLDVPILTPAQKKAALEKKSAPGASVPPASPGGTPSTPQQNPNSNPPGANV